MGATLAKIIPSLAPLTGGCNGHDALCGRKYSDVVMVGSHNSAFVGPLPSQNQFISVTDQLNLGVRFLQAQTHNKDGTIQMCHTTCQLLDQGTLTKYLQEVANWMNSHPKDVVTVLLTNGDAIPVAKFGDVFRATGLEKYAFKPNGRPMDQWGTLQQLIDAGSRLVVFMDYHSNTNSVPYIADEFAYFWETAFGVTEPDFPSCAIDRPPNLGGNPGIRQGIMNHFLNIQLPLNIKIPAPTEAPKTNSRGSIESQANLCRGMWGRFPKVVLLDFVNVGDAMLTQNVLNGL